MELQWGHGLVGLCLVGTGLAHHMYMSMKVMKARKQYNVQYPNLYAPESNKNAKEFNCVQRAHQNCLENLPTQYALLLTAGAKYPISAAICGFVYLVGRIMYFNGYSTGDPNKRMRGGFNHIATLGLMGMVVRWSVELIAPAVEM